jgi:hypothetical protein
LNDPWDRQDDAPAQWFDRFDRYRLLGPLRTLEAAWRGEAEVCARASGTREGAGSFTGKLTLAARLYPVNRSPSSRRRCSTQGSPRM